MDNPVIVHQMRGEVVAGLIAIGGALDALVCRLFSSNTDLTANTVWEDLTESAFPGYSASGPIIFGDPWVDVAGVWHVTGASIQFTCLGPTTPEVAYGYALTTSGGSPVLKTAFRFADPVPMDSAGDAVIVLPDFPFPAAPTA